MDNNEDMLMESLKEVLDGAYQKMRGESAEHSVSTLSMLANEFSEMGHDHILFAVVDGHIAGNDAKRVYGDNDPDDPTKKPATVRPIATPDDRQTMVDMLDDPRFAVAMHKVLAPVGYILRSKMDDGTYLHAWIDGDSLTLMDGDGTVVHPFGEEAPEPKTVEQGELVVGLLKTWVAPQLAAVKHKHLYRAMLQEIVEDDQFMEALGLDAGDLLGE